MVRAFPPGRENQLLMLGCLGSREIVASTRPLSVVFPFTCHTSAGWGHTLACKSSGLSFMLVRSAVSRDATMDIAKRSTASDM
eukprot:2850665-Amphidinium_carterae.1